MKALPKTIVIKIDTKQKEKYKLTEDVQIYIEKGYNFNLREDRGSMAYVVDGDGLTEGHQLLVHHLSTENGYHIEAETILTAEEKKEGYKVYSIPVDMAFCSSPNGKEWFPCKDFLLTLRIFKPYKGALKGIEPSIVKNRAFVLKGFSEEFDGERDDLSGKTMCALDNFDYQVIWHNRENREQSLIRTRSRELIATDDGLLEDLKKGKYLIGITLKDCKTYKEYMNGTH